MAVRVRAGGGLQAQLCPAHIPAASPCLTFWPGWPWATQPRGCWPGPRAARGEQTTWKQGVCGPSLPQPAARSSEGMGKRSWGRRCRMLPVCCVLGMAPVQLQRLLHCRTLHGLPASSQPCRPAEQRSQWSCLSRGVPWQGFGTVCRRARSGGGSASCPEKPRSRCCC